MLKIVRNWALYRWVKIKDSTSNKMIFIYINSAFSQALQSVRSSQQTTTHLPAARYAEIKLFTAMLERLLIPKENHRNCAKFRNYFICTVLCLKRKQTYYSQLHCNRFRDEAIESHFVFSLASTQIVDIISVFTIHLLLL